MPWGKNSIFVNWRCTDSSQIDEIQHNSKTIAILTTAYARMCLRKSLVAINKNETVETSRLLYCDTDSIIYLDRPNKAAPDDLPIGNGLGQLTNTLEKYGRNSYIVKFCSIAPKAYSYVVYDPDSKKTYEVNKCKGISVSSCHSEKLLTYENFEKFIDGSQSKLTFTNNSKIKRKSNFKVVTEPESKNIKFTYNKRIIIYDNITVPYGYDLRSTLANTTE